MNTPTASLRVLAHRAMARPRFLAGHLAAWQERNELTDAQAAERLGLAREGDYYLLALCFWPEDERQQQQILAYLPGLRADVFEVLG